MEFSHEMMMNQSLSIKGLYYEEVVLLQELLVMIDSSDLMDHPILIDDRETFNQLYNKVMNS
jgi:hypothetical protein